MGKAAKINKAIDWIAYAAGAYFIGTAIAGVIKKRRTEKGTEGIGAVRKNKRRIWKEIETAQRHGIDLTNPDGWKDKTDVLKWMSHGKVPKSNSDKPDTQRYFNQLRRAYKSVAGTNLPYDESIVRNDNGDVILVYRDYHMDQLPERAAEYVYNQAMATMQTNPERAAEFATIALIANGKKFVWNSTKDGIHRGVEKMLFGKTSPEERKKRISYLASPAKGGMYVDEFVHKLWEQTDARVGDNDLVDGVLTALSECNSVGEAKAICEREYLAAHQADNDILWQDVPF